MNTRKTHNFITLAFALLGGLATADDSIDNRAELLKANLKEEKQALKKRNQQAQEHLRELRQLQKERNQELKENRREGRENGLSGAEIREQNEDVRAQFKDDRQELADENKAAQKAISEELNANIRANREEFQENKHGH